VHTLLISFSVAWDGDGGSYSDRYDSLMQAIRRQASGPIWAETTSLVAIKSGRSPADMLETLYFGSSINEGLGDKLLVVRPDDGTHAARGMKNPSLLASFFRTNALGGLLGATNALRR
jgi:hypothetical protein